MSKGLRILGQVAGVVAIAATVIGAAPIAAAATAVAALASTGVQLTAKKPPMQGSVNNVIIGNLLPIPYVMGRTYTGGSRVHEAGYGTGSVKNPFYGAIDIYSGGGPVQAIESFQSDFTPVSFSSGNAVGYYNDYLYHVNQLGACPEVSALTVGGTAMPDWDATSNLSGYAAGRTIFVFSKNGKRYTSGRPQIGAILQGVKAYDPRLDSTYPGGSGAHLPLIETTYAYTQNPGLHGPTYALGRWQNGKKALGIGIPADAIDWPAWVEFANVCDTNGWNVGGTIYEGAGISRWDNLKRICEAGGGVPVFVGAKLSVKFNAPKVALDTITLDDLADGQLQIPSGRPWKDRKNSIVPFYRSEAHKWEYVDSEAVTLDDLVTADGELKSAEFKPQLVQDKDQAAELATYELLNMRERGPIILPLKPRFMEYRIGEALDLAADLAGEMGLPEGQVLVITGRAIDPATGIVEMTFETEDPAKHAIALGQVGTAPPVVTQPSGEDLDDAVNDNSVDPAFVTTLISTSFVTDADPADGLLQGTDTQISIEAHTRTYSDKTVSVASGTMTSLTAETAYHIFYDDAGRAGGAVTYQVTTDPNNAATTPANPYRHYVGSIDTDAVGGTGTSGGGSSPPGWGDGDWHTPIP